MTQSLVKNLCTGKQRIMVTMTTNELNEVLTFTCANQTNGQISIPSLGLEVHDPWEVVYTEVKKSGVVEKDVILECGPSLPDVYIWGFTKPGTDTLRAVVYNFGRGPKIQRLTKTLGELNVNDSSASISIAKLPLAAQGLYTCQALYDTAQGARLYYYYIYLRVLG